METLTYPTKTKANKEHKCMYCCGIIEKGSVYLKSSHKLEGDIYTWKTHVYCNEIADKINMYEDGDGLGTDDFQEYIKCEYQKIMSETQSELYESKDFKYPKFLEQLQFVLKYYKITTP